jgi:hypothetical protein
MIAKVASNGADVPRLRRRQLRAWAFLMLAAFGLVSFLRC